MRSIKKFFYGILFLIIIALILFGVYKIFFNIPPTCFDGWRNQGESDVDCGGPCVSCDIKSLKELVISQKRIFKSADGIGAMIEIFNPNPTFSASKFSYNLFLKDQFGQVVKEFSGDSFIYAGELKYIVEPYIKENQDKIINAGISIKNISWVPLAQFQRPTIETREVKTSKDTNLFVSGKVSNKTEFDFSVVNVVSILYNKNGDFLSASKTNIENLAKFSSKDFKTPFPKNIEIYEPAFSGPDYFTRDLKIGDSGEDVGYLQDFLAEMSFLDRQSTKYFDEITSKAVERLQAYLKVGVNGSFDSQTRSATVALIKSQNPESSIEDADKKADPSRTKVFVEAKK